MCQLSIYKLKPRAIVYNQVFTCQKEFTIEGIYEEIKAKGPNLKITLLDVEKEIDHFLSLGLLLQNIDSYKVIK